jgi:hypothetical protein
VQQSTGLHAGVLGRHQALPCATINRAARRGAWASSSIVVLGQASSIVCATIGPGCTPVCSGRQGCLLSDAQGTEHVHIHIHILARRCKKFVFADRGPRKLCKGSAEGRSFAGAAKKREERGTRKRRQVAVEERGGENGKQLVHGALALIEL